MLSRLPVHVFHLRSTLTKCIHRERAVQGEKGSNVYEGNLALRITKAHKPPHHDKIKSQVVTYNERNYLSLASTLTIISHLILTCVNPLLLIYSYLILCCYTPALQGTETRSVYLGCNVVIAITPLVGSSPAHIMVMGDKNQLCRRLHKHSIHSLCCPNSRSS